MKQETYEEKLERWKEHHAYKYLDEHHEKGNVNGKSYDKATKSLEVLYDERDGLVESFSLLRKMVESYRLHLRKSVNEDLMYQAEELLAELDKTN